jgi:Fe-S oxidoreductase
MAARPFSFEAEYHPDRCEACGECFRRCPVLNMDTEEARAAMAALRAGEASRILTDCTGCMGCNAYCPNDAHPHALILERWRARYEREGIPARGRLVLPYQQPNLYSLAIEKLPEKEKATVAIWRRNWREPPSDTMIFAGCNLLLQPFLAAGPVTCGLDVFGAPELCCGEPLYRMGCRDVARAVAERLRDEFQRMSLKKVVMPCLAGYHLFRHVYPRVLGIDLNIEVVSLIEILLARIEAGALQVAPLKKSAVVHDSCWPKAAGEAQFDLTRDLLNRIGVSIVEPAHTREEALCCGMCAAASRYSLADVLHAAGRRLDEFAACDADLAANYCGGCNWIFQLAGGIFFWKKLPPQYHLFELVQAAAGMPLTAASRERGRQVLRWIGPRLAAAWLRPGRFHIDEIAGHPVRRGEEGDT